MEIQYILKNAIDEIDILEEYYSFQYTISMLRLKEEEEKYKYGMAIFKYFCAKAHLEENPHCLNDEEKNFIEKELSGLDSGTETLDSITYRIRNSSKYKKKKYVLDPVISERKMRSFLEQPEILNDSVLMMLIVQFEKVISDIYRELLYKYPNAYLSDKSISYSVLMSIDSNIESVKNRFIDIEIENFMRQSLKEWYKTFEKKHNIKFSFNEEFELFKEIYYRRNIVVHNQGVANDAYINGVVNTFGYKIGDHLKVNYDYLINALDITRKIIIKTLFGFNNLCSDKSELAKVIFDIGYKYMTEKKWEISQYCFTIIMDYPELSEADLWQSKVNYYISKKNQNGLESIEKDVKEIDVSLMSLRMAIAKPALLDDFSKISDILENTIGTEIRVREVKEWPLFLQYRESSYYSDFIKRHKDIFSYESFMPEDFECVNEEELHNDKE